MPARSGAFPAPATAGAVPGFVTASLPLGIYAVDDDAKILYFNDRFCEIWGLESLKEKLQDGVLDNRYLAPLMAGRVMDTTFSTRSDGAAVENLLLADGRTIRRVTAALREGDGGPAGVLYTFDDLTECRECVEGAAKIDEKYRELADMLPQIIFEMGLDGHLNYVNRSSLSAMGYTQEEFVKGMNVIDVVAPCDRQAVMENVADVARQGKSGHEYTILRKDGSTFPAIVYSSVIYRDGTPAGLRGMVVDITEQKRAGEELLRMAGEQKAIADAALAISQCQDDDEVCRVLGEKAFSLNHGAIVMVTLYDPGVDAIRIRHYSGADGALECIIGILGQDPMKMPFPLPPMTDAERTMYTSGRLELIAGGLYELALGGLPEPACGAIEKQLGIDRVYAIGFSIDSLMRGGLIILLRRGQELHGHYVLETLMRHATEVIKHRQAEKTLQESQRFQSTLISNLPGMVYRCHNDRDWTMEYASDGCRGLTGYGADDLVRSRKMTYEQIIHPDDRARVREEIQEALDRDEPFKIIYRIVTASGKTRWAWERGRRMSGDEKGKDMLEGFITDITERKQAEEALREKQQELQSFIDSLPGYAYTKDRAGHNLLLNRKFCDDFGLDPEKAIGKTNAEICPPDIAKKYTADDETVFRTGEPLYTEEDGIAGGERRTIATRKIPLKDADGRVTGLIGLSFDVSELKRAEQALRESEASLSRAEQMAHIGNWTYDMKRKIMHASPEIFRIFQISQVPEISRAQIMERVHPEDRVQVDRVFRDAARERKPVNTIYRLLLPDDSERYVRCEAEVRYDAAGMPDEVFGVTQDFTEFRHVLQEMRKLSRVVEQSPGGVVITAVDGSIAYVNPAMTRKTGYTAEELIGRQGSYIWGSTGTPEEISGVFAKIRAGESWQGDHEYVRKDGGRGWSSMLVSPIKDEDGQTIAVAIMATDITDRKQNEARIKASLAEKEVLLKEVHHRVKNNLQVISSLLSLEATYVRDADARQMLEDSQQRIRSIALVHEKIYGSGDLASIDFTEYLRNLTAYMQHSYSMVASRVSLAIEGDPIQLGANLAVPLGLILNELISNSYKHGFPGDREGAIAVRITAGPRPTIEVADNGVGLPPDMDIRKARSMGMQLVCTLADQIEGEIKVENMSPGTRFTIAFSPDR